MADFKRFDRAEGTTWALWEFNDYETQMNDMYWAGEAARGFATYSVKSAPANISAQTVLHASGPNAQRFPGAQSKWLAVMSDQQNWNRASFVMAATGAFERYMNRIVKTAILSDPGLIYGKSRAIEGVSWLKLGIAVPDGKIVEALTKGEWTQRYAAFVKLFGEIPEVRHYLPTLDEAQNFRNSVGHSFGRNLSETVLMNTRSAPKMQKIKQAKLMEWFAAYSRVANAIDVVLLENHIGDFEPLLHFHHWLTAKKKGRSNRDETFKKSYRKELGSTEGHSKGLNYCAQLIAFYDAVV